MGGGSWEVGGACAADLGIRCSRFLHLCEPNTDSPKRYISATKYISQKKEEKLEYNISILS